MIESLKEVVKSHFNSNKTKTARYFSDNEQGETVGRQKVDRWLKENKNDHFIVDGKYVMELKLILTNPLPDKSNS